jgi:hypothetical protein
MLINDYYRGCRGIAMSAPAMPHSQLQNASATTMTTGGSDRLRKVKATKPTAA